MRRNHTPQPTPRPMSLSLALIVALLLALVPSFAGAQGEPPDRVHGYLKWLTTQRPNEMLPVIVQKSGADDSVQQNIQALGGRIFQDMGQINAFAADLPAKSISTLGSKTGVKWISYDAPVISTGTSLIDSSRLSSTYPSAIMAPTVWNELGYTGDGVTVAVIDSGVERGDRDIEARIVAEVSMVPGSSNHDELGHGTHMAGIIAGDGSRSGGKYIGVAPKAKLVSVKVSNSKGIARSSDVIRGLLWTVANKDRYGIRVVNLSVSSTVPQSYLIDPLDAAAELAWFNGIVVVAAAGNLGTAANAVQYAPANDPFVITVGSVDDAGTNDRGDDSLMWWSSRGKTQDGFDKPEVTAPGRRIVSLLSSKNATLAKEHPDMIVDESTPGDQRYYFKMGGTSTSAAAVTGVVALMLQAHPTWTPDQVKSQLMSSSDVLADGVRYVRSDRAAAPGANPGTTNAGLAPSLLLLPDPRFVKPNNVAWNNVAWNNVAWNNVAWNNVAWNNVAWNNVAWNNVAWNNVAWNNVAWNNVAWNNVAWNNVAWNGPVFD